MPCIFRKIFHFPCPTCGSTRALLSLLKGNCFSYYYYNVMALPVLLASFIMLVGVKNQKKVYINISIVILVINFIYYIFRLLNGLIP